jgi:glycosyltransferase involved in cell wall biosynthesis
VGRNDMMSASRSPAISLSGRKPRILLLADGPNWIFERHCYAIKRLLGADFQFTISYSPIPFDEDEYDLVYPLEWNLVPPERIKNPVKYVTGIRGHVRWPEWNFPDFIKLLRHNFQRTHVVSARLFHIFEPHLPFVSQLSHGVDTQFFRPDLRTQKPTRTIRVGWAGNKNAPADKGFHAFIEPLQRLNGVEVLSVGYDGNLLDQSAMREFYRAIDVYVCASLQEGNCNPLLESAAMGLAIVTTDNGTVPEYLAHNKSALIVQRTEEAFRQAVEFLRDNPDVRESLGLQARQSVVTTWDWDLMARRYKAFFEEALSFKGALFEGMSSFCSPSLPDATWNLLPSELLS